MKKLLLLVFLLLSTSAFAQTKAITLITLAPSATGLGSGGVFGTWYGTGVNTTSTSTDAQEDSVWTSLLAIGKIGGLPIYTASKVLSLTGDTVGLKSGRYQQVAQYQANSGLLQQYIVGQYAPVVFSAKSVAVGGVASTTDTGLTAIGQPAAPFTVTAVVVVGGNDTNVYTSNATTTVGTSAGNYNNLVTSLVPPLGGLTTLTGTLVSPRVTIPAGATIWLHVATGAVATKETMSIYVIGTY